jgi:ABC-type branched-subunit amino acid transport system substrate-binding protein
LLPPRQSRGNSHWGLVMWSTSIARVVTPLSIAVAMVGDAAAQETIRVGMVMPLTGTLATAGKQVVAGARL